MRNRAKCTLCNSILESFTLYDYVQCKCTEIAISGGNMKLEAYAKDWKHFMRVDDAGNETPVKVEEKDPETIPMDKPISHEERKKLLMDNLEGILAGYEKLPDHMLYQGVTNADMQAALFVIKELFK